MAQTVYDYCLRHGKQTPFVQKTELGFSKIPLHVGWLPMKGVSHRIHWTLKKGDAPRPFFYGNASLPTSRIRLKLLEFAPDVIKELFERLRSGKTKFKFEVNEKATEEYFRHIDSEVLKKFYNARTRKWTETWVLRKKNWPNHGRDCELMQMVFAMFNKLLPWEPQK